MRKCLRCETDMVEDLTVMVSNGTHVMDVREQGAFKPSLGKLHCAVCPLCGYAEVYIKYPEDIKKLSKKRDAL